MISAFSWQNSVSLCPASFRILRLNFRYSRYFLTAYFCIPVPYNEKDSFFQSCCTERRWLRAGTLSTSERSYPTSEVRGSGLECQAATAQKRPRVSTPRPRSVVAGRRHPASEVRGGSWRSYPASEASGGWEETPRIHPRSGAAGRSHLTPEARGGYTLRSHPEPEARGSS